MRDRLRVILLLLFQFGELAENLFIDERLRVSMRGLLFAPILERQFPNVASADRILSVFAINEAKLKQKFIVPGVGLQALPQELFGLIRVAEMRAQPIRSHYERLRTLRVQFRGKFQPRKQFARVAMLFSLITVV